MTALNTTSLPRTVSPTRKQLEPITTPRRLRALLGGVLLATAIAWAATASAVADARRAAQTIGRDSVPSMIAAQEIRSSLARANACAVRAAACSREASGGASGEEWASYQTALGVATDRLVTAAQNITYPEERAPIVRILDQTNAYTALTAVARSEGEAGRDKLRAATRLMREEILPAAEALDLANFSHLDAEYAAAIGATSAGVAFAGLLALGALAVAQAVLAVHFRRLVNPGLAFASLVLLVALGHALSGLARARADLRVAKADAFDSIHSLSKARALAHDARADEAFFVLTAAETDEREFAARAERLVAGSLDDRSLARAAAGKPIPLDGHLGDALRNVTFEGERGAVVNMLRAFRDFDGAHGAIVASVRAGDTDRTASLSFGARGAEPLAFARLDAALDRAISINRTELDRSVASAFLALDGLPAFAAVAALVAAVSSWLGLRARLREYAA